MSEAVILILISQIFGIIILFVTNMLNNQKNKRDAESRDKSRDILMSKQIKEVQNENVKMSQSFENGIAITRDEIKELKKLFQDHVNENDFPLKFNDLILKETIFQINSFRNLSANHIKSLNYWSKIITEFGLTWFNSSLRVHCEEIDNPSNNSALNAAQDIAKFNLNEFLNSKMDAELTKYKDFLDLNIPEFKVYKASKITFAEYIDGNTKDDRGVQNLLPIHNKTQLLIMALVNNGFKQNSEIINIFVKYIKEFCTLYFKKLDSWTSINDKNVNN